MLFTSALTPVSSNSVNDNSSLPLAKTLVSLHFFLKPLYSINKAKKLHFQNIPRILPLLISIIKATILSPELLQRPSNWLPYFHPCFSGLISY